MLKVGDQFPDFRLTGVTGTDHEKNFIEITESTYEDKWKIYFFWPKDFTFVCPTEITGFADLCEKFKAANAQVLGASVDSDFVHAAWRKHHNLLTDCPFPWLSDIKKELSEALGILNPNAGVSNRATFIVDPNNTIRYVEMTDLSVGRNPEETLRILDALQSKKLTPCGWKKGSKTLN